MTAQLSVDEIAQFLLLLDLFWYLLVLSMNSKPVKNRMIAGIVIIAGFLLPFMALLLMIYK